MIEALEENAEYPGDNAEGDEARDHKARQVGNVVAVSEDSSHAEHELTVSVPEKRTTRYVTRALHRPPKSFCEKTGLQKKSDSWNTVRYCSGRGLVQPRSNR